MTTIRERTAAFATLVRDHPEAEFVCRGAAEDRSALLAAGDALAKAAAYLGGVDFIAQPCPCWAHVALAAWKAEAG